MSTPDPKAAAVARAQFGDLGPNAPAGSGQEMNLNLILDVMVTLALEVGRVQMSVRDLLQLAPGAIVELDRLAASRSTCWSTACASRAAKSSWSTKSSASG
jgi:flagellar motor switch protein FliN